MNARNGNAPAGNRGAAKVTHLAGVQSNDSTIESLLNRLENVRQYGRGWRARCPSHGSDRNQSLSIAVGDDGRVLLHCFAECSALDVVHAIGLEVSDLFPARITKDMTPAERRKLRELARQSQWRAALPMLHTEAVVVLLAAGMVSKGQALDPDDDARLLLAIERIASAKVVFCGR